MVVTPTAGYIFHKGNLRSFFRYRDMSAIIRSSESNQVVFLLPRDKDLRFKGIDTDRLNDLYSIVKLFFFRSVQDRTLRVYVIPKPTLVEYALDKRKYGYDTLPDEQFRVHSEEI